MVLLVLGLAAPTAAQPAKAPVQQAQQFKKKITKTLRLEYLLFVPKGYGQDSKKKWPLVLFLHGAGERGDSLDLVKVHGIPKIVEEQPDFPAIAISPQCPQDGWWGAELQLDALEGLLDQVIRKYRVDPDRVYLTGLSMGGYGTWALALRQPKRFAALVPICGGGDSTRASLLKDVPVWIFHGAKDDTVPPEESQKMYEALKVCGGNVRFTLYPEADHLSWVPAYADPALYDWLFQQRRKR
ncbi:MAG: prolyl oligopeptidase family serine peptidase [Candidatus Latescibacteria bacterium]|nr:prolyl oligopeptidase family serine peptidase [Candidatus Latescibacterota bacterium]